MSEHLPDTNYLDPELLQRLGDLEVIAREVVERLSRITADPGAPAASPEARAEAVHLRLAALPKEAEEFVDPAALEEARLFNALRALGG